MLEVTIHIEDSLLAELLVSETARELARKNGLEARHFSDYNLNKHGTRARFYQAIMDAPQSSFIEAAAELERSGQFIPGDCQRLLNTAILSLHLAPDYEYLIDKVIKDWRDREISRLKKAGDYTGIQMVAAGAAPRFKGGVEL